MSAIFGFRPTKIDRRIMSKYRKGTGLTASAFMRLSIIEGAPIVKARFIGEKKTTGKKI